MLRQLGAEVVVTREQVSVLFNKHQITRQHVHTVVSLLRQLDKLRGLALHALPIDDGNLEDICQIRTIRRLSLCRHQSFTLHGPTISDGGVVHVGNLEELTALYLDDTRVTDRGLTALTSLKSLRELYVSGLRLTDASVPILASFNSLKLLDVRRNDLSTDAAEKLASMLPRCVIISEHGVSDPGSDAITR
ncbi:MAG: hypothetical protein ISR77_29400 [Pirellulaceae bacterium]|nr:hypothetical protein [Pirellulaceae bacterium]